jgi:hypothetical protein
MNWLLTGPFPVLPVGVRFKRLAPQVCLIAIITSQNCLIHIAEFWPIAGAGTGSKEVQTG